MATVALSLLGHSRVRAREGFVAKASSCFYLGVSDNQGYLIWGPCNKDPSILGAKKGPKLPFAFLSEELNCLWGD